MMMDEKSTYDFMAQEELQSIRNQFPILQQEVNEKPLCYLDSAASAQKPLTVLNCTHDFESHDYSNIHRGMHTLSMRATAKYEEVRGKVAGFLGATSESEIVFTSGTTAAINLIAQTWGRTQVRAGDEILVSELEHHSNIVPWQLLAEEVGARVIMIPMDDDGVLDLEAYTGLLGPKTKLVAVNHVANAIGTINPVKEMASQAHEHGSVIVVDGAQSAPHMKIDVVDLDCDFFAFSAHKMYGPTGTGALFGKAALLKDMPPWQGGGDMIDEVSFAGTTYNDPPMRFEAGTPNITAVIGMGAAVDWMQGIGIKKIATHENALLGYATKLISEIPGVRVIGTAKNKAGVLSFWSDDAHPQDIGTILDQYGVAVRAGHHCAQPVMKHFAIPATARASFAVYNTPADVEQFIIALKKSLELFA